MELVTRVVPYAVALGAILLAVAVVAGVGPVVTDHGGCGTWLAPSAPDDLIWGPACDAAQQARRPFVVVPATLGLVLLLVGGGGRLRRRTLRTPM